MPPVRQVDKPLVSDERVITFDPWTVIAFLYPLTKLFTIKVGGTLFGQDVLAMAVFLFFVVQKDGIARLNQIWPVLVLITGWLFGQILTDFYRDTPLIDYSRGWLKIAMFGLQIASLWMFLPRRSQYLIAFLLGHAVALVAGMSERQAQFGDEYLKFGAGTGLGLLVAIVFSGTLPGTRHLRRYAWIALTAFAFFLLMANFRSGFGAFLIAAGVCFILDTFERLPDLRRNFSPRAFTLMLLGGVAFSQVIFGIYGYFAGSGALGEAARYKYEVQSSGDVSILLGGRVESLVSVEAVKDSPILGHGSWAKDLYYARLLQQKVKELGVEMETDRKIRNDLIPTHSYLMGAWVEAGILGALFWIYIYTRLVLAVYRMFKHQIVAHALLIVPLVSALWAVPFSPFGAEARFSAGLSIVIALMIIKATSASPVGVRAGAPRN